MISDIETILSAFKGSWKPGIEEQSIRMAHAVALQGDTATASNILKFIAIPEPMKLQILGASLHVTTEKPATPDSLMSTTVSSAPITMPEPLMTEQNNSESMTIPSVNESDIKIVNEEKPVVPAFGTDMTQVIQVPVEEVRASAPVVVETPPLPTTPISSLPYQRDEIFSKAFASVQTGNAGETSRPMVRDADNISVIHTYAQPAPSEMANRQNMSEQAEKGVKIFATLDTLMRKAMDSTDGAIIASAIAQWERVNAEFPDYKSFHRLDWSAMEGMFIQLQKKQSALLSNGTTVTHTSNSTELKITPESSPVQTGKSIDSKEQVVTVNDGALSLEKSPETSSLKSFEATTPITAPVASVEGGGYFAMHRTTSKPVETADTQSKGSTEQIGAGASAVVVPASLPEQQIEDRELVSVGGGTGYFARKVAKSDTGSDSVGSPVKGEQLSNASELPEIVLPNNHRVTKNMTITGASVYRVVRILSGSSQSIIVFTDEIKEYHVPAESLSSALDDPNTKPDEFFAQFVK